MISRQFLKISCSALIIALAGLMTTQAFAQTIETRNISVLPSQRTSNEWSRPTIETFSPESLLVPTQKRNALGLDVLVSTSGFGLGVFYRRQYTEDVHWFASFSISEVRDEREVDLYNPFTGEKFVPGKINRFFLMPLILGIQYRLFREDIADNFRPYVTAALGPSMVYSTPYEREFFNSLGHGQAHYTLGGYVGFGAFFGLQEGNLAGVSFRYYVVPLKNQLESLESVYKKQFGGFFITLNIGTVY